MGGTKRSMRNSHGRLSVGVALALVGAVRPMAGQPADPPPTLRTSGVGTVAVAPTFARLLVSVENRDVTAAAAAGANAAVVVAVRDTLVRLGFDRDSILTASYTVSPVYDYDRPSGGRDIVGHLSQTQLAVTVRRLDEVGPVIDAVLAAGASGVPSVAFDVEDRDPARRRAIGQAVTQARADAEALARAAGGRLGRLRILTTLDQPWQPSYDGVRVRGAAALEQTTDIPASDVMVVVTVQGEWEFVPLPSSGN